MANRNVVLMCPSATIVACRQQIDQDVPALSGLIREVGPNSAPSFVTHYLGSGVVDDALLPDIGLICATHGATWAFLDVGPSGENFYPTAEVFLAAFNLVFSENEVPPV